MSDALGPMVYGENEGEVFLGRSITTHKNMSDATMQKVDQEIRRIIDEQYALARSILEENRDKVEAMTKALLEWETIDAEQIEGHHGRHVRRARRSRVARSRSPPADGGSKGAAPSRRRRRRRAPERRGARRETGRPQAAPFCLRPSAGDGHRQRHPRFVFRRRASFLEAARAIDARPAACARRAPTSSTSAANRRARARSPFPLDEELRRVIPVVEALVARRRGRSRSTR